MTTASLAVTVEARGGRKATDNGPAGETSGALSRRSSSRRRTAPSSPVDDDGVRFDEPIPF